MLAQEELIDQEMIESCVIPLGDDKKIVISAYIEQIDGFILEIEAAIISKNYEQLQKLAHSVKGASLQLGFHQLGMVAKELEVLARERLDQSSDLAALNNQLRLSYEATLSYIHEKLL